jgi:hypothetical protein
MMNPHPARGLIKAFLAKAGVKNCHVRSFLNRCRNHPNMVRSIRSVFRRLSQNKVVHSGKGKKFLAYLRRSLENYCMNPDRPHMWMDLPDDLSPRNPIQRVIQGAEFFRHHEERLLALLDYFFGLATIHLFGSYHNLEGYKNLLTMPAKIKSHYLRCQRFFIGNHGNVVNYIPAPVDWNDSF